MSNQYSPLSPSVPFRYYFYSVWNVRLLVGETIQFIFACLALFYCTMIFETIHCENSYLVFFCLKPQRNFICTVNLILVTNYQYSLSSSLSLHLLGRTDLIVSLCVTIKLNLPLLVKHCVIKKVISGHFTCRAGLDLINLLVPIKKKC